MFVNGKIASFKEFYFLNESLEDDIQDIVDDMHNVIMDERDPYKERKISNLKNRLIANFERLEMLSRDKARQYLYKLVITPFKNWLKSNTRFGLLSKQLALIILHLMALLGMKNFVDIKDRNRMSQKNPVEIVSNVEMKNTQH